MTHRIGRWFVDQVLPGHANVVMYGVVGLGVMDDCSRGCVRSLRLQTSPRLVLPALTDTWWWLRFKGPF